ncbi:MAG TPA: hypothetical protein VGI91_06185 [Steroidobacteraceae bacterium]|jgi:hypothetical protein
MNTRILAALTVGCLLTGTALADTIVVGDKVEVRESQMATPRRGTTMSDVEKHFGAPTEKHPTVGQPPITRWDYNGFAVVFEHDRVIDSVVIGG